MGVIDNDSCHKISCFPWTRLTTLGLRRANTLANYYRAMHFSAKRGIAIVYCLSVCPSVTFRYRDHIGWNSSKLFHGRIA